MGLRFELAASTPELLSDASRAVRPFASETAAATVGGRFALRNPGRCACGATHEFFALRARGTDIALATVDAGEAVRRLRAEIKLWLAEHSRKRVVVHAGAVGWNGVGVLLPGRTRAGKTTLVRAFLEAGADYYSDDFAVIDLAGRLHPFPVALGVRASGEDSQIDVEASDLGARVGSRRIPVGAVVMTQHRPDAIWVPESMSAARTVLALIEHAIPARSRPAQVLDVLSLVCGSTQVRLSGHRSSADEVVQHVLALLTPAA